MDDPDSRLPPATQPPGPTDPQPPATDGAARDQAAADGSPAALAGLLDGDVIIAAGERRTTGADDLIRALDWRSSRIV